MLSRSLFFFDGTGRGVCSVLVYTDDRDHNGNYQKYPFPVEGTFRRCHHPLSLRPHQTFFRWSKWTVEFSGINFRIRLKRQMILIFMIFRNIKSHKALTYIKGILQIKFDFHFFGNADVVDENTVLTTGISNINFSINQLHQTMLTGEMLRRDRQTTIFGTTDGESALKHFMGNDPSIIEFEGEFHGTSVSSLIGSDWTELEGDCKSCRRYYNFLMILKVKLINGESLTFKSEKPTCVIGRSGQCDLVIPHEAVSRKHCQIDYREGELYVTDLGSINGVLIDGQKITPNKPVNFQSYLTLSFGAVQTLNIELDEERTSVQVNPLLATTLNVKEYKPKPQRMAQPKISIEDIKKKDMKGEPTSMANFIVLCVVVVLGFAFFIFKDDLLPLLGL